MVVFTPSSIGEVDDTAKSTYFGEVLHLRSWYVDGMRSRRPPMFRKRQFEPIIIVTCVRWYCRFSLSLRDLEELMAETRLSGGPHHHLALGSALRAGSTPASAGECEAEIFHLAHG